MKEIKKGDVVIWKGFEVIVTDTGIDCENGISVGIGNNLSRTRTLRNSEVFRSSCETLLSVL